MNFEQAAHSLVAPPERNDRDEKIFFFFRKNLKVQHEFDMNVRDVVHAWKQKITSHPRDRLFMAL